MTAPPDSPVRRADVLWRRVLDGVLVRRRGDDDTVLISGGGVALWDQLGEPIAPAELIGRLARDHDTSRDVVAADVERLLVELRDLGLVIVDDRDG